MRRLHGRPDESGFTLVEILVSSALSLMMMVMGYQILSATSHTASAVANRSQNSTSARLAIDYLEANLRYADAVLVCGPVVAGVCSAPVATIPPLTASTTNLFVENAAVTGAGNDPQPACAQWTLTTAGLVEASNNAVNGAVVMPGVSAYPDSTGFSIPTTGLVEIDLSVNKETVNVTGSDAVTVHDLISPNNISSALSAPALPCVP